MRPTAVPSSTRLAAMASCLLFLKLTTPISSGTFDTLFRANSGEIL
jgi:hypothetical protein